MHTVITGATRGIGLELRNQLVAGGANVTGTYRGDAPDGSDWIAMDLGDPASIANGAAAITEPIDLLVCNAGVYLDKGHRLEDGFDAELWAQTFAVNVTGVFLTIQHLLPRMPQGGKIAIISSQMGSSTRAQGGAYIYRSSKAAVLNLGRNLACELAPREIPVGIYHPGWVQTDMGGSAAAITTSEAATGLIARFAELSPDKTGCFEMWDGTEMPF